ncbi:hypothetical protein Hanom_Chr04g00285491 [Helianthus anomalus]
MKLLAPDFSAHFHNIHILSILLVKVMLQVRHHSNWDILLFEVLEGMETFPRYWLTIPPNSTYLQTLEFQVKVVAQVAVQMYIFYNPVATREPTD